MSLNVIDQQLSIFIPFVFPNITQDRIGQTFHKLNLGDVERVDFVDKVEGKKKYKMAFVHLKEWYMNESVGNIHDALLNGKGTSRIVYDDPWFWNIFVNKKPRTVEELALERDLAITKEILQSETNRANYFQAIAMTWNHQYPHDCVRIHNMIPFVAYQPVDSDPIEGYGVPFVVAPSSQAVAQQNYVGVNEWNSSTNAKKQEKV